MPNKFEEEKYKLLLAAETELLKQKRQYHLLQKATKSSKLNSTLCKQKRVLNVLRIEHNELQNELGAVVSSETADDNKLQNLLHVHSQLEEEIEFVRAHLNKLDGQIALVEKRTLTLRRCSPKLFVNEKKFLHDRYTLETLENKLECQTKRFCFTLSENRKLREEINHHLKERAQFTSIWNKLLGNLATARKYMIDLIETATISYDRREEWVLKLNKLRNRAYNDYIGNTLEMTEMQRLINEKSKLEKFLIIKGQKRVMKNLMNKELLKREEQRKNMQDLLELYTTSLKNIKKCMGESTISNIVKKYVTIEFENYAKFKQVIRLNCEIENLGDEVALLHIKIDDDKYIIKEDIDTQVNIIKSLELELEKYKTEADKAENEFNLINKMLYDTLAGIEGLFNECKCSYTPFIELLGNNTTVNMHNVHKFLQLLETRLNDIIINIHFKEKKKFGSKFNVVCDTPVTYHAPVLVHNDPCPLCVEKAMVSDVVVSLEKALSKSEIEEQLRIAKQQDYFHNLIHNVSRCHLPKSRAILQARFE